MNKFAVNRLAKAWARLFEPFLLLAGGDCARGVPPFYAAAGDTLAVPLGVVCAAAGEYPESTLAALAAKHGVALVVGKPCPEYAHVAGLELDDGAVCCTLEHLPYLLCRLSDGDVDGDTHRMRVKLLRDRAFEVIQASCVAAPFSETAWGFECFEMEQRKGVEH